MSSAASFEINTLTLALMASILTTGCPSKKTVPQTQVPSKAIVRYYEVSHDDTSKTTKFVAQFRNSDFNGDSVQLTRDEYVSVAGDELHLRHGDDQMFSHGTDYTATRHDTEAEASYAFDWHKAGGDVVSEVVSLPVANLSIPKDGSFKIRRDQDLVLEFSGEPYSAIDNFDVRIGTRDTDSSNIVTAKVVNNSISVPLASIRRLWLGDAYVSIERSRTVFLNDENEKKSIQKTSIYREGPFQVEIVE